MRGKPKLLSPKKTFENGKLKALSVVLYRDGKRFYKTIHRLVLEAFVGPCPEGLECAHYDGDPSNNCVENLRWDSHAANCADRVRHGTEAIGERNPSAILTETDVLLIRKNTCMLSALELARRHGVSKSSIFGVRSGRTWSHV